MINFKPYANQLTELLQQFILDAPHYDTGDMYRSIYFEIWEEDDDIQIELRSKYYIVYLDDGTFLNDFFNDSRTEAIMYELSSNYTEVKLDLI